MHAGAAADAAGRSPRKRAPLHPDKLMSGYAAITRAPLTHVGTAWNIRRSPAINVHWQRQILFIDITQQKVIIFLHQQRPVTDPPQS